MTKNKTVITTDEIKSKLSEPMPYRWRVQSINERGAATLLQMANDGVSKPENCKFTQAVGEIKLNRVCAIIKCTKNAQDNLSGVAVWSK